jgi:peptidylprolyl isomerase
MVGQPSTTGSGAGETVHTPAGEPCPLCGAPLDPEQEWCLRCGAAARTRLATSPNWKAPIIALAVVAALSLGVIAAALVKLAGNSSSPATPATTTVAAAPAVTPSVTSPGTLGAPGTPTPSPAGTPTPGAASTPTPGAASTPNPSPASGPLSKEPNVTPPSRAPSKLLIRDLITGTGAEAKPPGAVTVNYVGVLFHSGREFDSSWKRGRPLTFYLSTSEVVLGWAQGVPGMRVGGRRELVIPAALAYGTKGSRTPVPAPPGEKLVSPTPVPVPPNETLVFVIDLLKT